MVGAMYVQGDDKPNPMAKLFRRDPKPGTYCLPLNSCILSESIGH